MQNSFDWTTLRPKWFLNFYVRDNGIIFKKVNIENVKFKNISLNLTIIKDVIKKMQSTWKIIIRLVLK